MFLLFIFHIIRYLRLPLFLVTKVLSLFSSGIKERFDLERAFVKASCKFSDDKVFSACFEISSEGEFEQVLPLIESYLEKSKNIEILYFSGSVKNKCEKLKASYSSQIKLAPYPVLSFCPLINSKFSLKHFIKSETLYLCRYDFWPELMLRGHRTNFILLNATLKAKKVESKLLRIKFSFFDRIFPATQEDIRLFKSLELPKTWVSDKPLDMRAIQVNRRVSHSEEIIPLIKDYNEYLQNFKGTKLIMGSCWGVDIELLNSKIIELIRSGSLHLCLAPHLLRESELIAIEQKLSQLGLESVRVNSADECCASKGVVSILTLPRILCEAYTLFDIAYVGGGFGRSIHSVMEPFMAKCLCLCGPKVFRSTEYDLCLEYAAKNIHVINNSEELCYKVSQFDEIKLSLDNDGARKLLDDTNLVFKSLVESVG